MSQIENILMQDELFMQHFVAKHPPKYEFTGEINPAYFGRNSSLDYALTWLKDYIGLPLIEDNFEFIPNEGHTRKQWRINFIEKYGKECGEFFKNNKLRKNISMGGLNSAFSIIDFYLGEENPILGIEANKMVKATEELTEEYLQMASNEKIAFVRRMEDNVYEFVNKFLVV